MSCTTLPSPEPKPPHIVIDWPAFPDPLGLVTEKDGIVSMPYDYWLAVTRYVIDAEAAHKKYQAIDGGE